MLCDMAQIHWCDSSQCQSKYDQTASVLTVRMQHATHGNNGVMDDANAGSHVVQRFMWYNPYTVTGCL